MVSDGNVDQLKGMKKIKNDNYMGKYRRWFLIISISLKIVGYLNKITMKFGVYEISVN